MLKIGARKGGRRRKKGRATAGSRAWADAVDLHAALAAMREHLTAREERVVEHVRKRAAEILGISPSTADRHWVLARAWLYREMQGADAGDNS